MDEHTQEFAETFTRFLRQAMEQMPGADEGLTPFGELVQQHLGADVTEIPSVEQVIASHRLVDADLALAALAEPSGAAPLGLTGSHLRDQAPLPELIKARSTRSSRPAPSTTSRCPTAPTRCAG